MSLDLKEFRATLGVPAYEDDDVLLYLGNCLDLLAKIPPASVPLTVTSPPYSIGKEYEIVKQLDEYVDWTRRWTRLVYSATCPDGSFWLNLGYTSVTD
jgi:adenine-specific DNA-methyltransferase